MKLSMLKFRGHSITLIGAISLERGLIHYEIFDDSNNADRFDHFLIGLKNKCQFKHVAVVQDNLRIHYANAVQGIYHMNFVRHMLPTYLFMRAQPYRNSVVLDQEEVEAEPLSHHGVPLSSARSAVHWQASDREAQRSHR
jgi:hypothetical protein